MRDGGYPEQVAVFRVRPDEAVARLSARSWRLAWLTPLATDVRFKPETAALKSILPFIDDLAGSGSTEELCAYVLGLAQARAA